MNNYYSLHDKQYIEAKENGWSGWGGDERIAKGEELIFRLLDCSTVPKSGNVLDLGCGEGHLSRRLSVRGYTVTGIDVSTTAINWAKEKTENLNYNINYYAADLTIPKILDNQLFDIIIDGNCYHCIIDDDRQVFLQNIYNALKPNGIFFISSLCSKEENDEKIYQEEIPYRHIPSVKNITRELNTANFKMLKKTVYQRDKYNHINIHATKFKKE